MSAVLMTYDRKEDAAWRNLSDTGNQAMQAGNSAKALALYRKAMRETERLFASAEKGMSFAPVAVILVISCKNLSDASAALGDLATAQSLLKMCFDRLERTMETPSIPFRLRVQCMSQLKFAFLNLAAFSGETQCAKINLSTYRERGLKAVFAVTSALEKVEHIADFAECQEPAHMLRSVH